MSDFVGEFSPALQDEDEPFGFDFRNDLIENETIQTALFSISVINGVDLTPSSHLSGSPVISGTKVNQRISDLLPGVTYRLQAIVTTSQANTKSLWGRVTCKG